MSTSASYFPGGESFYKLVAPNAIDFYVFACSYSFPNLRNARG